MARIHDTEKGLQGKALSNLGTHLVPNLRTTPAQESPGYTEAADAGERFRHW